MKRNIGDAERWIRLAVGVILIVLAFAAAGPGWGRWILVFLGLIAVVTGGISYCPLWQALGLNTFRTR